ncbi:MAG: hypothetical protein F6K58_18830 [Symploca sp. SIO2E9]|nr:hypothetical protein [Symploca sp. SIO2E9]
MTPERFKLWVLKLLTVKAKVLEEIIINSFYLEHKFSTSREYTTKLSTGKDSSILTVQGKITNHTNHN